MDTTTLRETVRWGVKSGGGLVINLALLTVWVDGAGIPAEIAVGINWLLLSVYGYLIADGWVFGDAASATSLRGHITRWASLQAVMAGSKAANYTLYLGGLWLGVDYRLSWAGGALIVFCVSFAGGKGIWTSDLGVDEQEL
jgi:putative flippase GtrA